MLIALPIYGLPGFLVRFAGSAVIAVVQHAVVGEMEDGRRAELKEPTARSWRVVVAVTVPFLGLGLLILLGLFLHSMMDIDGWS